MALEDRDTTTTTTTIRSLCERAYTSLRNIDTLPQKKNREVLLLTQSMARAMKKVRAVYFICT